MRIKFLKEIDVELKDIPNTAWGGLLKRPRTSSAPSINPVTQQFELPPQRPHAPPRFFGAAIPTDAPMPHYFAVGAIVTLPDDLAAPYLADGSAEEYVGPQGHEISWDEWPEAADDSAFVAAKTPGDATPPAQAPAPQQPVNEPPNELLDELTGQQVKLLKFLWTEPHGVDWDSLPRDAFRGEDNREDSTVKRALERLQERLNEFYERFHIGIKINAETRRVKLDNPSRTNSDK